MSGHSHWATIRRKKGAADAKHGQIFTPLAREIALAARVGGGDPSTNVSLELAIDRARAQNMPKDNIERAIKRGTGESKEGGELEQVFYEGYANHGIALMMEVVTDNRNRAVAEIRHALTRNGGSMAEAGSVGWQFNRAAYFSFPAEGHDQNKVFELSSQVSDGAAAVLLTTPELAAEAGLEPLARWVGYAVAGVPPEIMGIGPVEAIPNILGRTGLRLEQMDVIELNEAFAAQSLAVLQALGLDPADPRTNANGGAIALGHPLGCTGTKLTATALHELRRRKGRYAMVTMCIGTGMGAAGIFEAL